MKRGNLPSVVLGLCFAFSLSTGAVPVSLGGAADYAVLGTGGSASTTSDLKVYQSGTVINGNVGMGPYTLLQHGIDATIHGRFDYDLTASLNGQAIVVPPDGGVHQINLSGVVADARAASLLAAGFAPTQTYSTLSENQVIIGNGGLNVIRITGDVTLKQTLTLQGNASDSFIFQFTSGTGDGHDVLELSGMQMILAGGVQADNVVWNLSNTGGGVSIHGGGTLVYGNFLAPDRDIHVESSIVLGRLIGGGSGNLLDVHSTSTVTAPVPDSGATVLLLALALGGILCIRRSTVVQGASAQE
jgi:hypothetical protein